MAAEAARNPFDRSALVAYRAFRVQVVHVLRPVLDGRIAQVRVFANEQLNGACVQVRHVVFRGRAAFDEVQIGAIFYNDERVLELACALRIQAEVTLQREVELGVFRHVHEAAARPHGAVERCEFMVGGRNERHEFLANERLPLGVVQRFFDA